MTTPKKHWTPEQPVRTFAHWQVSPKRSVAEKSGFTNRSNPEATRWKTC